MEQKYKIFKLYEIRTKYFNFHYRCGFGWVRLFGIGFAWKDINLYGLTFSQRNGYTKYLKIGKWRIIYLPVFKYDPKYSI